MDIDKRMKTHNIIHCQDYKQVLFEQKVIIFISEHCVQRKCNWLFFYALFRFYSLFLSLLNCPSFKVYCAFPMLCKASGEYFLYVISLTSQSLFMSDSCPLVYWCHKNLLISIF